MPTTKQKYGLVSQYREMALARLDKVSRTLNEIADCLEDPSMAEAAPSEFAVAAKQLRKDASGLLAMGKELQKPNETRAEDMYNHGRQIHARNKVREISKRPMPAPKGKWELSDPHWRDIHGPKFIEAYCPHGIGHHNGVHGCDGCCAHAPIEIWEKVSTD